MPKSFFMLSAILNTAVCRTRLVIIVVIHELADLQSDQMESRVVVH